MALMLLSGAAIRAGFARHAYSVMYNAKIPRAQESLGEDRPVHTAEHLASAMFWMGVPRTEIPRARLHAVATPSAGTHAVLHPYASTPEKTWPAEHFIAVAKHLLETGIEPIFIA